MPTEVLGLACRGAGAGWGAGASRGASANGGAGAGRGASVSKSSRAFSSVIHALA